MIALKLERVLAEKGIHYAWFMAFISFFLLSKMRNRLRIELLSKKTPHILRYHLSHTIG